MTNQPTRTAATQEDQLGSLLLHSGRLSAADLERAREICAVRGGSLAHVLVEERLVTEADLVATLADHLGFEYVDLTEYPVDAAAARLISDSVARRYDAIPIGWSSGRLMVAMVDPSNVIAVDDIRTLTGAELQVFVTTRAGVLEALGRYHRFDTEAENISAEAASSFAAQTDLSSVKEVYEDAPIVKLINMLITQAAADRASDIHIEPGEHDLRIRYRIDGVLHQVMMPPKSIQAGMISRLKVMANLNIAERRVPQDGRITTT
ncbi:MAG: GspE/PulE family protein, partial [Acidimicrobiales bacterium]